MGKNIKYFDKIYEDDNILVINKAENVLSIPDRYNPDLPSLISEFRQEYEDIFTVHRLDKGTSGVMVFAKNSDAHKHLNEQFQNQEVKKIYHAIVQGVMHDDGLEVDIPITTHPGRVDMMMPSARGKSSLSILKVLERFKKSTLLEVDLVTGRQHQLRVHCSAVGHPLLVDPLYGDNEEFYVSTVKKHFNLKKGTNENPIMTRISMHAHSIAFQEPGSGEILEFEAEYPKDFSATLKVLRKYSKVK